MMLIVRLYPEKGMASLWRSLEKHIDSLESENYIALYASQLSGQDNVNVVFELKKLEDIEEFYTQALIKIPNIRKTETLTLMRTRYFQVPKDRPEGLHRFLIHINMGPKYYSQVYDKVCNFKYPKNVILTYVSYSFGRDDLLVSVLTDSVDSAMELVENKYNKFPGVQAIRFTHVIRSMLLVGRDRWKKHQKRYMEGSTRARQDGGNDWGFDDLAGLSGGFTREMQG